MSKIIEIVDAVAETGCNPATVNPDGSIECDTFTAEFFDWQNETAEGATLAGTNKFATVFHRDREKGMEAGDDLVIGRTEDGRWILLVWYCYA